MRILHVATLITPDGAYGGPIRVALNLLSELKARGHRVALAAGQAGFGERPPTTMFGVPLRLFPVHRLVPHTGFAGLVAPRLNSWVRAQAPHLDIGHVHLARDLVTMPAARALQASGLPYVLQTHGMIDESENPLAKALDVVWTRDILKHARAVFYLTDKERESLTAVSSRDLALTYLRNGVRSTLAVAVPPGPTEVLYLARLHQRKRPDVFVQAASALAASHPTVRFTLVGPDEGMGVMVKKLIAASAYSERIRWEGPLRPELTIERMTRASLYVLPSINEPFPMSVLEALSLGRPVVITDTCGLAPEVLGSGAGVVVKDTVEALVAGIDHILRDTDALKLASDRALHLSNSSFSISAVVDQLEAAYRQCLFTPDNDYPTIIPRRRGSKPQWC